MMSDSIFSKEKAFKTDGISYVILSLFSVPVKKNECSKKFLFIFSTLRWYVFVVIVNLEKKNLKKISCSIVRFLTTHISIIWFPLAVSIISITDSHASLNSITFLSIKKVPTAIQ